MRSCLVLVVAGSIGLFIAGCGGPRGGAAPAVDPMLSIHTLRPEPAGFLEKRMASGDYPIPPYAKFLRGAKICLDPGHGGDASQRAFKRGPSGVREAEFNLRVARYLKAFLEAAEAEVKLTRDADVEISLEDRANVANAWNADLFIPLHHNAIDNKPQVNHTTVWYHNDVDYRPADLDLARYLCQGLYDALALPQITDVPLKSDQLMYDTGFGVLRHARVTAALTETSFYTNPDEEQRLRDPEYNLREAYGLFRALAKYAAAGWPKARLIHPADGVVVKAEPTPEWQEADVAETQPADAAATASAPAVESYAANELVFELDDGLRGRKSWGAQRQMILTDSIAVRVDGAAAPFVFEDDGKRYRLRVTLPDNLEAGEHEVEVQFQNMNKNSVLNPRFRISIP